VEALKGLRQARLLLLPADHAIKMKYAWDWFQYHADQRLKSFNYFVVVLALLVAGYGAALKEGVSNPDKVAPYSRFAVAIAVFGIMISLAFLVIEVRNYELVECSRKRPSRTYWSGTTIASSFDNRLGLSGILRLS